MAEAKKASPTEVNPLTKYVRETRGELRKVTWPTREEALRLTRVVLLATLAFALFLGILDFVFSELMKLLVNTVIG